MAPVQPASMRSKCKSISLLSQRSPAVLAHTPGINRATVPVEVTKLHYVFEGWLGDAPIESTPCFLATEELAATIREEGLSGGEL